MYFSYILLFFCIYFIIILIPYNFKQILFNNFLTNNKKNNLVGQIFLYFFPYII